ncbi:MAG: hypothetical protein S4CHLAM37_17070 [Chlamydiia bacterium]|nr:hypothetical protein [Chlamydiia bacterium]
MPANGKIGFSVRIGDSDIPEYHKDGQYYVESNLFTPVSYLQEVREMVYGEIEAQEWPVTPYAVKVYVSDGEKDLYYSLKLFIDGVKIDSTLLRGGESQ